MKRFYQKVTTEPSGDGFHILLDGKPIKTPDGHIIVAPNVAIAQAMQQEWQSQGERIDWNLLPVTRLVGGGQTISNDEAKTLREDLAAYVDTDMLAYWGADARLKALQTQHWQPVLDWVRARFDVTLKTTFDVIPIAQSPQAHKAAAHYLASLDHMALVVMGQLVPLLGSVWLGKALREQAIDVQAVIVCAQLEEQFQATHWGVDEQAARVLAEKAQSTQQLGKVLLMLGEDRALC